MISLLPGKVTRLLPSSAGPRWVEVDLAGESARALCLEEFVGPVEVGHSVLLNTSAVEFGLGSGGFHVVVCNLDHPALSTLTRGRGHIMKLRYTPFQHAVLAVEEPDSPDHPRMKDIEGLRAAPVLAFSVHSQLLPVLVAIKRVLPKSRVAYVYTDGGALPAGFSEAVGYARGAGLLTSSISCGNAFGGDIEAVNVFSALQAARVAAEAEIIVAGMGPGIVGTATALGHTGMEQAVIVNAAASLGGSPVAVARLSFADRRTRHQGISHHTLTALSVGALATGALPLPRMEEARHRRVEEQVEGLRNLGWSTPTYQTDFIIGELKALPLKVTTMGRAPDEDPEFFMAAAAAGVHAAQLIQEGAGR